MFYILFFFIHKNYSFLQKARAMRGLQHLPKSVLLTSPSWQKVSSSFSRAFPPSR